MIHTRHSSTSHIYANVVHGKKTVKDKFNVSDALRDFDLNEDIVFWWRCLQDLSNFRQKLRKHTPEVSFLDIEDDLFYLDKVQISLILKST